MNKSIDACKFSKENEGKKSIYYLPSFTKVFYCQKSFTQIF